VDWKSDAELSCLASSPPEGAQAPLHLLHVAVANQRSVASPDVRVYGVGGGARYEALVDDDHALVSVPGAFEAKLTSTIEVNCDAVVIGGIPAPDGISGYGVCSKKLGEPRMAADQVMSPRAKHAFSPGSCVEEKESLRRGCVSKWPDFMIRIASHNCLVSDAVSPPPFASAIRS
jgi:hypothetical protein